VTAADEALYSPSYVRLAHEAWWRTYAPQVELFGKLSAQTLAKLEEEGREIATADFVRGTDQLVVLSAFLYANPYLRELIAASLDDTDQFRALLTLFVQLADLTP
jgi:hypothetical protein